MTLVRTRSSRRTPPPLRPFWPFWFFSSAMIASQNPGRRVNPHAAIGLRRQKRSRIVELARLPLGPGIQNGRIHLNLPVRTLLYMRAIHWPWRRTFKVDAFVVVSAAVAWTFEFVLRRLPVWSAPQMSAARVNYE